MENKHQYLEKLVNKFNYRYVIILIVLFVFLEKNSYSQGAAVNTSGTAAHPSAMLDISSSNSGILIPRLNEMQKNSISSPAVGLMIYQIDGITGFWYYDGSAWVQAIGPVGPTGAAGLQGIPGVTGAQGLTGATGSTGPLVNGSSGQTLRHDGSGWTANSNLFNNGTNIGIGTNSPNASAAIDISSTTKGTLITRMTTSERNAIGSPAQGLQIFNTDNKCFEFYNGTSWMILSCGCNLPSAPTGGIHVTTEETITWQWNALSGFTGYKYNTTNNYYTAIDNGTSTSYTQTGLTCSTSYVLYVWAYNSCGVSPVATLNKSTSACFVCGNNFTFSYRGSSVTYGTVIGGNSTCWMDRNLGATAVATSSTHSLAYGDLFQWGRLDDGHQLRSSSTVATLSSTDVPGHANFIIASVSPNDWRSGQNNNLWQGVAGINNPCPNKWRLPTQSEYNAERLAWGSNNSSGAYSSALKLTVAGYRGTDGSLTNVDGYGGYWSSTIYNTRAYALYFYNSNAFMNDMSRAYGMSVRCIKDY